MPTTQSKVVEIEDKRLAKWADEFASIYDEEGEEEALLFVMDHIPEKYHEELAPYVVSSLEQLGYTFEESNDITD